MDLQMLRRGTEQMRTVMPLHLQCGKTILLSAYDVESDCQFKVQCTYIQTRAARAPMNIGDTSSE